MEACYMNLFGIILTVIVFIIVLLVAFMYYFSRKNQQHSIIRSHPYLGWMRYLLEKLGPEFRQYWFDDDNSGKPFSRYDYLGLIYSAKYRNNLIGFGSRKDFSPSGYYIANAMFPLLENELKVDQTELRRSKKYKIMDEGIFHRQEKMIDDQTNPWLYTEDDAIVVGKHRKHPWRIAGMFGASATSYGSVGEHYILSTGYGAAMAGGSWINTGEGGVVSEHLQTGADIVAQIGPGMFGYRTETNEFCWKSFQEKAAVPNIKAFELKMAQGAKIRGGHLEGSKVNQKIAQVRQVPEGKTINSPNRFQHLNNPQKLLRFIDQLQEKGGKPIGIKIVVGQQEKLEELFQTMIELDIYPDFITVDGSEGGSGATYKDMADSMGVPLIPGLLTLVDTAYRFGIRDKFRIFASGKLISPDQVAIALGIGADAINSARGFMMANGCIMALQCHTGQCPAGVATTDPKRQDALVPEEKKWRVMNYIISMRYGLFALAAAAGIESPKKFTRDHIIFKDETGRIHRLSDLFPIPQSDKQQIENQVS